MWRDLLRPFRRGSGPSTPPSPLLLSPGSKESQDGISQADYGDPESHLRSHRRDLVPFLPEAASLPGPPGPVPDPHCSGLSLGLSFSCLLFPHVLLHVL